jgi:hypothetical protein
MFKQVLDESTADGFVYGEAIALVSVSVASRPLDHAAAAVELGRRVLRVAQNTIL